MTWIGRKWTAYQSALRNLKTTVDGVERRSAPWPDWAVTTFIDTSSYWPTVWRAVSCHKTQMEIYSQLEHLPEDHHKAIWRAQESFITAAPDYWTPKPAALAKTKPGASKEKSQTKK